jgi:mRNA interferase RelE/StbE
MSWKVEFDDRARKELRKLNKTDQDKILKYLRAKISVSEDPRRFGKPLVGDKVGLWRYRVEDYRVIAKIDDLKITVLVLKIGHRKEVYK